MRKVQFLAVFWTLLLAIPMTVLALSLAAYTTEHLGEILTALTSIGQATTVGGRGWILEFAERWPEVAGMIVGQMVIMIILIFARPGKKAENKQLK